MVVCWAFMSERPHLGFDNEKKLMTYLRTVMNYFMYEWI